MDIFFYIFTILMLASSLLVITARNPVHAVLWLIFAFCNGAGLMVTMGAEFIAMMLIIIYVGAVAVLFLFVVMMLDIKMSSLKNRVSLGFSALMGALLLLDLTLIILLSNYSVDQGAESRFAISAEVQNAYTIGKVLYTDFVVPFQICGIILFVAMVASIALTLRSRDGVRKQDVAKQVARTPENSLFMAKENGKKGLENLNYDD